MKLTVEVEVDRQMLETIVDLWKAKWQEDENANEDDDAENESEDRDDESAEAVDAEAHRKALEKLAECLRDNGIADVAFTCTRNAVRRNRRR